MLSDFPGISNIWSFRRVKCLVVGCMQKERVWPVLACWSAAAPPSSSSGLWRCWWRGGWQDPPGCTEAEADTGDLPRWRWWCCHSYLRSCHVYGRTGLWWLCEPSPHWYHHTGLSARCQPTPATRHTPPGANTSQWGEYRHYPGKWGKWQAHSGEWGPAQCTKWGTKVY